MAPSFAPSRFDSSVSLMSRKHHFSVSLYRSKHLQRLFISFHIKSQLLCQFLTFRITPSALFFPPYAHQLPYHTYTTHSDQRDVSQSQSRLYTLCAFSSLECSPHPSLNSIHPSRPGLNLSSSNMPSLTTSSLAYVPNFKIQVVFNHLCSPIKLRYIPYRRLYSLRWLVWFSPTTWQLTDGKDIRMSCSCT